MWLRQCLKVHGEGGAEIRIFAGFPTLVQELRLFWNLPCQHQGQRAKQEVKAAFCSALERRAHAQLSCSLSDPSAQGDPARVGSHDVLSWVHLPRTIR